MASVWCRTWNRIHFVRVWIDSLDAVALRFVMRLDSLRDILSLVVVVGGEELLVVVLIMDGL